MKVYHFLGKNPDGLVFSDDICRETAREARNLFNEFHKGSTIITVQVAHASRSADVEALELIEAVLNGIDPSGPVGAAFKGCAALARNNLRCDIRESLRDYMEAANAKALAAEGRAIDAGKEASRAMQEKKVARFALEGVVRENMALKARLYDMMVPAVIVKGGRGRG